MTIEELEERVSKLEFTLSKLTKYLFPKKIKCVVDEGGILPTRAHIWDAGLDLYSPVYAMIPVGCGMVIDTNVRLQLPQGYYGDVKSRSSMFKCGLATSGTIDCGYTGHIKVVIINHGLEDAYINPGDRIAQLVITNCHTRFELEQVDELEETERGTGGFGSSGK